MSQHLLLKSVSKSKHPSFSANRGTKEEDAIESFAKLITDANSDAVKETLLTIKMRADFDSNSSALKVARREALEETLAYLTGSAGNWDQERRLNKEGLVLAVQMEVSRRLPFKCESCEEVVTNDHATKPHNKCGMCGIGACPKCFSEDACGVLNQGKCFVCPPCGIRMKNTMAMPDSMLLASKIKVTQSQSQKTKSTKKKPDAVVVDVEILNESSEDSDSESDEDDTTERSETPAEEEKEPVQEDDFIVHHNKKQTKLLKKAAKPVVEPTLSQTQSQAQTQCFFHLNGGCRHGISGKKPVGDVLTCPREHSQICHKYLNNGAGHGGCIEGKKCPKKHPRMCKESLENRQCTTQKVGENRCRGGYHLRSTKLVEKVTKHHQKNPKDKVLASAKPPAKSTPATSAPSSTPVDFHGVASFLEVMMREMLTKMLGLSVPIPPPVLLPPPPPKGDIMDQLREALKYRTA
jgi:hypothetical protein